MVAAHTVGTPNSAELGETRDASLFLCFTLGWSGYRGNRSTRDIVAAQRIGEILRELPKAKAGRKSNDSTAVEELPTKAEALKESGISRTQAYDRSALVLQLEPLYAAEAKRKQQESGKQYGRGQEKVGQNSAEPIRTDEQLAKLAGTSRDTIRKTRSPQ